MHIFNGNPYKTRLHEAWIHTSATAFGQAPPLRFLIFAQGRTGTWLMTHFLNAHPAIYCEKEILMYAKRAPLCYMGARSRRSHGKVYGCHVQINQLLTAQHREPQRFLAQASAQGWRILYMTRRDIVRQSISTILATRRRQWYAYDRQTVDMQPQTIAWTELEPWLQRRIDHAHLEKAALQQLSHLSITYEDDLQDTSHHQATMDRVFAYLDLPTVLVTAQTERLSRDDLRDTVANYEELIAHVGRSPFASYTDLC